MNKVEQIVNDNFDGRLCMMVLSYIMDKGTTMCQQLTDKEIDELEGNAMMTKEFVQSLVRTARKVATECNHETIWNCIFENMLYRKSNNLTIWKDDFSNDESYEEICYDLDVDPAGDCIHGRFVPDED